jgi:hypothetical protein
MTHFKYVTRHLNKMILYLRKFKIEIKNLSFKRIIPS